MRKTCAALIISLLIGLSPLAAQAQSQPLSDAELATVSGSGITDPMMTMMGNMMVVMSAVPVMGPIHDRMMSAMNQIPVLGPLHLKIMAHATLGGGHAHMGGMSM